jgi:hypothetical protein
MSRNEVSAGRENAARWWVLVGAGLLALNGCGRYAPSKVGGGERLAPPVPSELYVKFRERAMESRASDIGVDIVAGRPGVWGVVMDRGLADGTATLVAFANGRADLYLSSGEGIAGGPEQRAVQAAASNLVAAAAGQVAVAVAQATNAYALPAVGEVAFFFLTTNGIAVTRVAEAELCRRAHALSPIFQAAQAVVTELHLVAEKNAGTRPVETTPAPTNGAPTR